MDALVADLQAKLYELSESLAISQSTAKQVTKQSGLIQADLNLATKAAGGIAGVKETADQAIQEAQSARSQAESLIETLGSDDVVSLIAEIGEINRAHQTALEALACSKQTLSNHLKAAKDLELEVAREQEEADKAYADLTNLPSEVKALVAALKTIARDLAAASDAHQPLKAYVRRSELDVVVERLQALTSDSHVSELTGKYMKELHELSEARDRLGENEAALAPLKAAVATAQADADKAAEKLRTDLDALSHPKKSSTS